MCLCLCLRTPLGSLRLQMMRQGWPRRRERGYPRQRYARSCCSRHCATSTSCASQLCTSIARSGSSCSWLCNRSWCSAAIRSQLASAVQHAGPAHVALLCARLVVLAGTPHTPVHPLPLHLLLIHSSSAGGQPGTGISVRRARPVRHPALAARSTLAGTAPLRGQEPAVADAAGRASPARRRHHAQRPQARQRAWTAADAR